MFAFLAAIVASAPSATELTIYNQGFALIKETRSLSLKEGRQSVAIEDVASLIEPTSVSVRSIGKGDAFSVLEQNYQYDLISPAAILNKSVGSTVRFVRTIGGQREVLEGTLISAPNAIVADPRGYGGQTYNGMVIRTKDGRIVLDPTGEIEVQDVPKGLISKPTLQWDLDASKAGETPIELSYISKGLNWNADYVLTLDGEGSGGLQGWVTLDNQSGATFENAKLKLLAGDVQRVSAPAPGGFGGAGMAMDTRQMAKTFNEETLFEYHLYTLQRPATVKNRETKQISLLTSAKLPVTKRIIVDSVKDYGRYLPSEGEIGVGTIKPQVRVEFENKLEYGLGVPLPKGNVKVYQRDKSGSVQLLGEDAIDHTPRNEKLSLVVGRSFDIVANRKRTNFRVLGPNRVEESFEIEVRNRKETTETVTVLERNFSDWTILNKSQDFVKMDAFSFQFNLNLKPNESRKVTYTIESRW